MEAESSATSNKMSGGTIAVFLYWGAWCLIGVTVFVVIAASVTRDYPKQIETWQIILYQVRTVIYIVWAGFVLFGISGLIRAANANTRELQNLRNERRQ